MEFQISSEHFWSDIEKAFGTGGGVYKLFAMQLEQRLPVGRFLGFDAKGVLYIGKAVSFLDRVIELKKSLSPHCVSENHDCGKRYKSHETIRQKFSYENLYVELLPSSEPANLEKAELEKYRMEFGEAPPLNSI